MLAGGGDLMPVCLSRWGAWMRRWMGPVLLAVLPFARPAAAMPEAGECTSEWALSTRGISIGSANDRVRISACLLYTSPSPRD